MTRIAIFVIVFSLHNLNGCFANSLNYSKCNKNHCIDIKYLTPTNERVEIHIHCSVHFTKDLLCDNVWSNVTVLSLVGNWNHEHGVDLESNTFERFGHLEELRFVGVQIVTLYPGSFRGLDNLRILDLSNCVSLGYSNFLSAFESDATLPRLQELILHMTGNRADNFMLRDVFAKLLYSRPVRVLDLSDMLITEFEFSSTGRYARYLEFLNVSGISVLNYANSNGILDRIMPSLKILDLSRIDADKIFSKVSHFWCPNEKLCIPTHILVDRNYLNVSLDAVYLDNMPGNTHPRHVVSSSPIEVRCLLGTTFNLKNLYLRRNFVSVVDIELDLKCPTIIDLLDLSDNGLQYINPKAFWKITSLKQLFLSDNSLGEMVSSQPEQFQHLFAPFEILEILDLSRNKIATLLDGTFISNRRLKLLNLAGNVFQHFSFNLRELTNLEYLDLSDNYLLELDSNGLAKLNCIQIDTEMDFGGRTIQCSKCEHYNTVKWLLEHKESIFSNTSLTCVNSKADVELISKTVEENLHYICYRNIYIRNNIICSSVAFVCFCSIVVVVIIRIRRQRNFHRQHRRRQQTIRRLDNGQLQFAAFILYSSKDEEFMRNFVYANLEKNLQLKVDSERELVGFGDKNFKVGHCIMNEIIRCTKASATIVVVLSDNFCSSDFCLQEFDVAFRVGKPIILMLKGEVNISLAPVAIRDLFNTYVRVLWRIDDYGEYELMTSWDNVSNSILELGGVLGD
ncbi:uncharacterized protein LOC127848456 [Dreissena polymorpha]|uniref:TIR domain-containing protein n=1 Tax=Dreissena polymorpha TaxID=45954 RepID=A0A9D4DEL0_DREPO|nr:uncharacterized protein LOC127848456 [Dreissena polymorpha]KAH3747914.1 hypothetical protein DPMN_182349 [Dreissena polymorpha]